MLVIIDVKPKDLGLPTEAYISVEEIHDVSESWGHFEANMIPVVSTEQCLCETSVEI